jgi:hypothetical protein
VHFSGSGGLNLTGSYAVGISVGVFLDFEK